MELFYFPHFGFFHRGESRTAKGTKMKIFVSTINDSQLLTVVAKNFVFLDATGVPDLRVKDIN